MHNYMVYIVVIPRTNDAYPIGALSAGTEVQGRRDLQAKEALPQGPPENRGPPRK